MIEEILENNLKQLIASKHLCAAWFPGEVLPRIYVSVDELRQTYKQLRTALDERATADPKALESAAFPPHNHSQLYPLADLADSADVAPSPSTEPAARQHEA
jgi:hypothetical protein